MTYKLNEKQRNKVIQLPADQRYDHFIQKILDWEEVWSLRSEDGWVVVSSADDEDCLPVWPHPDYAALWAIGDWADCEPEAIKLDVWIERWIPGMQKDGTLIAVFPNDEEEGVVVEPAELLDSITGEMQHID